MPAPQHSPAARAYVILAIGIFCIAFSAIFVKWTHLPGVTSGFYRLGDLDRRLVDSVFAPTNRSAATEPSGVGLGRVGRRVVRARHLRVANVVEVCFSGQCDAVGQHVVDPRRIGRVVDLPREIAPQILARLVRRLCRRAAGLERRSAHDAGSTQAVANTRTVGNLLALLGAFFYAAYILTTQHTRAHLDTLSYLFIMSAIGASSCWPLNIAQGLPLWGFAPQTWLALLGLALITHVGGWLAIDYALGHIRASIVSVTLLAQPVIDRALLHSTAGRRLVPAANRRRRVGAERHLHRQPLRPIVRRDSGDSDFSIRV